MNVKIAPPDRTGRLVLPGGRALGWAEWGPPEGRPVLFCPGAGTSRSLGFGAGIVDRLGIRLISLDRPGLGASDPSPGRTLGSWAEDIRAAGLEGTPVVGFSQGAPFALACAAAGVATRVAIVSGADEIAAPHFRAGLPDELRGLVDLVATDPEAAEAVFARLTPDALWDMIVPNSPDRAFYESPGFATAYRQAMAEAFRQGPAGYARDTVLAMGRWPFDLGRIAVPVSLWYGELDLGHSPDQGESLASRIPGARRHLVPEAGGAVLWTHAHEILRELVAG